MHYSIYSILFSDYCNIFFPLSGGSAFCMCAKVFVGFIDSSLYYLMNVSEKCNALFPYTFRTKSQFKF